MKSCLAGFPLTDFGTRDALLFGDFPGYVGIVPGPSTRSVRKRAMFAVYTRVLYHDYGDRGFQAKS